ncbi:bifunctional phosphoribosyl-AMP cyclohydrolase/phosphoribosyl-ATP diphosphatase HisIE [Portibacter lacus]|uniref:Histidine biosynthesis bifunctional protein HisIE n=1 Tax=Portibacter lacus TaxID=1099794 RepID=A0AA37WDT1_9BACT|nr:bifunctional phosphoribosyl-AMP cyclohydrolase/phosphoribosyl-ATP diphosphatase HisIE [Portibacter lacus]GLR16317.1 histidine biosynthesis bifunctional protein HisIE [Portibacter lacus]
MDFKIEDIDFEKMSGLVPAIIQDQNTLKVLMQGFMNKASFEKTIKDNKVCFYSRSKERLWTKGEESGNFLNVKEILLDCDKDSLLIKVDPVGPVCHTGSDTCWDEENKSEGRFLHYLESVLESRKNAPPETSYTASLFAKGINKVAQKVGEEAVELVIEAKDDNEYLFLNESADLMYHYLVLLQYKGYTIADVEQILRERHK